MNCELDPGEHPMPHHGLMPLDKPTEVRFPRLWMGTWSLSGHGWGPSDAQQTRKVLELALDGGLRHLDTAGLYGDGDAERLVANVAHHFGRRRLFLSTKGGLTWQGRCVVHQGRPQDLRHALHQSLQRLQTDYLDLFQLHWPDPDVPLAESLGALQDLQREGTLRFWGVGNLTAHQVREHLNPGGRIPHQVHFNPIHRHTTDILHAGSLDERCLHCVVSPLEQGLLGDGRGSQGLERLGKKDVRRRNPHFSCTRTLAWVERFRELTHPLPVPRATLVLSWILDQPGVDVVIPGPRTEKQLQEVLLAADPGRAHLHAMPEDLRDFLNGGGRMGSRGY